jgi:hypothetical protein
MILKYMRLMILNSSFTLKQSDKRERSTPIAARQEEIVDDCLRLIVLCVACCVLCAREDGK